MIWFDKIMSSRNLVGRNYTYMSWPRESIIKAHLTAIKPVRFQQNVPNTSMMTKVILLIFRFPS